MVNQPQFPACYTPSLGDGQASLNTQISDPFMQLAFTEISWARPGGGHFPFFLFNPHNCGVSIRADYSDEIKLLSGFHSPMTLQEMTLTKGQVLFLQSKILRATKGPGCVPPVCAV